MMLHLDTADARVAKALALVADAGQWLKCRARDGRKAYGVPSQSTPGTYHLATLTTCTCRDFQRRQQPCKHSTAVGLHVARVRAAQAQPARRPRRVALSARRSTASTAQAASQASAPAPIVLSARTLATAARYTEIFGQDA